MPIDVQPAGWRISTSGPDAYERFIVPTWMGEWARDLVRFANIGPNQRVLDIACGTGVVAREVRRMLGPEGKVIGVDRDDSMLRTAARFAEREGLDTISWRSGDASHLPVGTAGCDVVLCQQGLQFFPDRLGALQEMARVLRPQGRLVLSVWRALECCPVLASLADVIERQFGANAAAVFHTSCSLTDREEVRGLLKEAGFHSIHIRLEMKTACHPSLVEFLPGYLSGSLSTLFWYSRI